MHAEMQESQLRRSASRLADQAGQAVAVGQDELARQAPTRRQIVRQATTRDL